MTVYKALFKVILKNLPQLMIYIIIFMSLAVALANTNTKHLETNFTETKVNMVFINNDTDSKIVEGLKDYLSKNANIIDIPEDTKKLQDALFFGEVDYIVKVPKDFTQGLIDGKILQVERTSVPNSTSSIYIDQIINKYINTATTYLNTTKNMSKEQLLTYIDNDLSEKIEVELTTSVEAINKNERRSYYFNYMAYALLSILILGVCSVMIVFNNTDLKKRNLCTPIRLRYMNFQIILGNLSFAILAWFAMIVTSFVMYGSFMFTIKGMLFLLNSFVFTLAALSISYLLSNLIKSRNAMSAAANVISLGTSFISGIFVPQFLLGKTVLKIASFTPNYWYVKSNNTIANLVHYNMGNLQPIFLNMLIVLGFAVAILAVTLVVTKQKRLSN